MIVTDANNFVATDTVTVTVNPNPIANAGLDVSICPGDTVEIGGSPTASSGTAPFTFSWTPIEGLNDPTAANPQANPTATTDYIVTVTD